MVSGSTSVQTSASVMDLLGHGSDTETQHHTVVSGGGTTRIGDGSKTERIFILKNVLASFHHLILITQSIMDERIPTGAIAAASPMLSIAIFVFARGCLDIQLRIFKQSFILQSILLLSRTVVCAQGLCHCKLLFV